MSAILEIAIKTFGEAMQIDVAIEECAELIKELCKIKRKGGGYIPTVAEEIADVEIMIEQLKLIFNCPLEVEIFKEKKLKRLAERIAEREK